MAEHTACTRDEKGHFLPGNMEGKTPPGVSGNPNGRPPNEQSITWWMRKLLAEVNGDKKAAVEKVARRIIAEAKKGAPWAVGELLDRTEGKAVQPTADVTDKFLIVDE